MSVASDCWLVYVGIMAEIKNGNDLDPVIAEEDAETLAAIERGRRAAEARHTTPIEEVRKLLPKWIIESSTRKKR
jgi:hypothetical protein